MIEQNLLDKTGIYQIENLVNGFVYIGSTSQSFRKRLQKHVYELKCGKHHSRKLQNAFNKYGEECFDFSVLSVCDKESCIEHEQLFIDSHKPEYNINPTAVSSLGVVRTDEYKKKLSLSRTGFKTSDEFKEKCRARMVGNTITKGRKVAPEVIAKIKQKTIGAKRSIETRAKMTISSTGRILAESSKQKIRESRMKYSYQILELASGNVVSTNNLREFSKINGLHDSHLLETFIGFNGNGRRIIQHKGFKVIEKNLIA